MFGLTTLGTIHTAVGIIALLAAAVALIQRREIAAATAMGKVYLIATVLTCVSAFGIFRHGGFNEGHVLGIVTLVVLAVAWSAERWHWCGRASPYVTTIGYSFTVLLHLVPGLTESLTRLPVGAPLVSGPQDPLLKGLIGACFVAFLIGAALQIRALRARRRAVPALSATGPS